MATRGGRLIMPGDVVINKEMGITHDEFFRNIGRVIGDDQDRQGNAITVADGDKRLTIGLAEQSIRHIALFAIPVTRVTLTFSGYGEDEAAAFIERFDNAFRRGGG